MLDDFRGKLKKRPKQQEVNGKIEKKGKGRPRKPNSEHLHLTMDGSLKARLKKYGTENSVDLSSLVSQLVRSFLKEEGF